MTLALNTDPSASDTVDQLFPSWKHPSLVSVKLFWFFFLSDNSFLLWQFCTFLLALPDQIHSLFRPSVLTWQSSSLRASWSPLHEWPFLLDPRASSAILPDDIISNSTRFKPSVPPPKIVSPSYSVSVEDNKMPPASQTTTSEIYFTLLSKFNHLQPWASHFTFWPMVSLSEKKKKKREKSHLAGLKGLCMWKHLHN